MDTPIERVAVIGAGNMGHGIAEIAAITGYEVVLHDADEDALAKGIQEIRWSLDKLTDSGNLDEDVETIATRITEEIDFETAVENADLVIEAVSEDESVKHSVFADLDDAAPPEAILASNTSSLSITDMGAVTDRPDKVVGLHFFNPPVKMDLVEVVHGDETREETVAAVTDFATSLGKTPIHVRKDVNGFVVNNVLAPFTDEPRWMVSAGDATVRQADAAMVHRRGYQMGPFELADMTGVDVAHDVRTERGDPVPPVLEEKVAAGDLGRKTGRGFYDYEDGDGPDYEPDDAAGFDSLRVEACMVNEAAGLVGDDVATPSNVDEGLRLGAGFPEGPCRRGDAIGLDLILTKLERLAEATGEARYEPADHLVDLVADGRTGRETGAGFFEYGGAPSHEDLNWELTDDGVLALELDRPDRLNTFTTAMFEAIQDVLEWVDLDDVRCVTFEGTGDRAFSAGADIGGFAGGEPMDFVDLKSAIELVHEYERPTLAKIDGYCLGAGLELALACDLRIATTDAEFGLPEINLGLIPGGGGTQRLARTVGAMRAKELILRGEHIDGERAAEWGLVNRAAEPDEFEETVTAFVDDLAAGPPLGMKMAKRVIDEGLESPLDAGLFMESEGFGLLMTTADATEGTRAFAEKRNPEFEGR